MYATGGNLENLRKKAGIETKLLGREDRFEVNGVVPRIELRGQRTTGNKFALKIC